MGTIQKKRPAAKKNATDEKFVEAPAKTKTGDNGDSTPETEESLEPVFANQYSISCGADEYVMPSTKDMTVQELRTFINENRPGGMSIDSAMPCFVNGEHAENEAAVKLTGNLRIEFTKKAGVKGIFDTAVCRTCGSEATKISYNVRLGVSTCEHCEEEVAVIAALDTGIRPKNTQ